MAAKALDKELNAAASKAAGGSGSTVVNDLSNAVRKKKKGPDTNGAQVNGSKRKLEEDDSDATDKKVKLD